MPGSPSALAENQLKVSGFITPAAALLASAEFEKLVFRVRLVRWVCMCASSITYGEILAHVAFRDV
jgi:hypothetical protein